MQPTCEGALTKDMSRMLCRNFLALGLCLIGSDAIAQCAPGVPSAGNPGCIPPNQPNSPYYQPPVEPGSAPSPPPIWEDRWAAVAVDEATGTAGISTGKLNKGDANRSAIAECQTDGAQGCKILISYYSQCVALAQAKEAGIIFAVTSPQLDEAKSSSLKKCGKESCSVVYTNCVSAQRMN